MKLRIGEAETRNFYVGVPVQLALASDGSLRRLTRWQAARRNAWLWLTKPFRRKLVVTSIDVKTGVITVNNLKRWYQFL